MRPARLARHRVPLAAGREGGAAAADQPGVHDLADHALGAELERPAQGVVAAVGAVVVEALGVDEADAAQQPQARVALPAAAWLDGGSGGVAAVEDRRCTRAGVDGRQLALERRVAGLR